MATCAAVHVEPSTNQTPELLLRESERKEKTTIVRNLERFKKFDKKVYVQVQWSVGMASYHFEDNKTMYINWSEIRGDKRYFDEGLLPENKKFKDDFRLPDRLSFSSTRIDEQGYFYGVVDFRHLGTIKGADSFSFRFKEESSFLVGSCREMRNGIVIRQTEFSTAPCKGCLCYVDKKFLGF